VPLFFVSQLVETKQEGGKNVVWMTEEWCRKTETQSDQQQVMQMHANSTTQDY
jgi:hypothetical protein